MYVPGWGFSKARPASVGERGGCCRNICPQSMPDSPETSLLPGHVTITLLLSPGTNIEIQKPQTTPAAQCCPVLPRAEVNTFMACS